MDDKKKKKVKGIYILMGIRNALICDGIAVIFLIILAFVYALIKNASVIRSIYMSFYYGGAVALLIAAPQFYKRNEDPKLRKVKKHNPINSFYDWFGGNDSTDEETQEGFQIFKGDGFWLGIMITVFGVTLLALAVILERMFFTITP
jgi:hypothetical protein